MTRHRDWIAAALVGVIVASAACAASASARTLGVDLLAGLLRPGRAEVQIGPALDTWAPTVNEDLTIGVIAHPLGHHRAGSKRRVFVRYLSPPTRCARSYAVNRGTVVGPRIINGSGHGPKYFIDKSGLLGKVNRAGDVVVAAGPYRWRRATTVRVCVWLGPTARTRIGPVSQDIKLLGTLFGAVGAHTGSLDSDRNGWWTQADATFPFRMVLSEPGCSFLTETIDGTSVYHVTGFYQADSSLENGVGCPLGTETHSYTTLPTGQPLGSISWTDADVFAPVDAAPVAHIGDCDFGAAQDRTIAETVAYVQAVGCRAGRTIIGSARQRNGFPARGAVINFLVHGAEATLVPPGTVVDLVVNR